MEQKYNPCCGIDVHKKVLVTCVRKGKKDEVRKFGTTTAEIQTMLAWITENQCQMTVMESTGSYWMPVWNIFEDEGAPIMLANAQQVKAVPGKKTDKKDAQWLAQLLAEGHIQPSFVPDRKHREMRMMMVQVSKYTKERSSEVNRYQKILETINCKLSSVVSDVQGMSAKVLLHEALQNGTVSAARIRKLQGQKKVSSRLKATPEELSAALTAAVSPEIRLLLNVIEANIDNLEKQISQLKTAVQEMFTEDEQRAISRLEEIPGIGRHSAEVIIGIIGCDMERFATADKLCSWAGVAPGNNESAGKRKSSRTTKGHALLKSTLVVCAQSAAHSKNTFLGSRYRRLVVRMGAKKAIMAIAHSILRAIWYMLTRDEEYQELGEEYYIQVDKERKVRAYIRKLQTLGMKVATLDEDGTLAVIAT